MTLTPRVETERKLLRLALEHEHVRALIQNEPSLSIKHYSDLWSFIQGLPHDLESISAAISTSGDSNLARQFEEIVEESAVLEELSGYINIHREAVIRDEVRRKARSLLFKAANSPLDELVSFLPEHLRPRDLGPQRIGKLLREYEEMALNPQSSTPIVLGVNGDPNYWSGYRMMLLMADTGQGKSTFLAASSLATLLLWQRFEIDKKLIFFVLEGGSYRLVTRWLSGLSSVPRHRLEIGVVTPEELESISDAKYLLSNLDVSVSEERHIDQILERVREEGADGRLGAVYIDYMQMVETGYPSIEESMRTSANALVDVGDELGIPIVVASQVTADQPFGARAIMHKSNLAIMLTKKSRPGDDGTTAVIKCVKNSLRGDLFEEHIKLDYSHNRVVLQD